MSSRGNIEGKPQVLPDLQNGRVKIVFSVPVEIVYSEDYDPETGRVTEVSGAESFEDGRVVVDTGSTMVAKLRGKNDRSLLEIRNYRDRTTEKRVKEPGAHVKKSYLGEDGQVQMRSVAKLSNRDPVTAVEGLGVFTWVELA